MKEQEDSPAAPTDPEQKKQRASAKKDLLKEVNETGVKTRKRKGDVSKELKNAIKEYTTDSATKA